MHVWAPVITGYVEWVLRQAGKDGIKRLYFMARDGYLWYRAAQRLEKKLQTGIELRYIRVSRFALRMAEYALPDTDAAAMLCVGGIDISFEKILRRAALTDEEIVSLAEKTGYRDRMKESLQYREIAGLAEKLRKIPEFSQYVKRHAEEALKNVLAYLAQEGLREDVLYALVDSGWIGTVQKSMQHLLRYAGDRDRVLTGYYFGLYELPKGTDRRNYRSFYLAPWKDIGRKIKFSICLFETVCSAPEGMTLGYGKRKDRYEALLSDLQNPNAQDIERNAELLESYLDGYQPEGAENGTAEAPVQRLLMKHMGTPSIIEANVYGSFQFCDDVLESELQDLARVWGEWELSKQHILIRLLIKSGCLKKKICESGWPEASFVRSVRHPFLWLAEERMYKRMMYLRKAAESRGV